MRKSYVFDEKLGKLVDKEEFYARQNEGNSRGPIVFGDLPDIVSSVDGKVIHGRAGMREHNRKHNVTFTEDFKQQWKDQAKERQNFFSGNFDKKRRAAQIAEATERVRSGYRPQKLGEHDG